MTKEEENESIEAFKKSHLENIQQILFKTGELLPIISLLVYDNVDEKMVVVMVPISGEFGENEKETLATAVIPQIFERLKDENKRPLCFSFSSEAWIRKYEGTTPMVKNWKELEKTEGLLTTFESKDTSDVVCMSMHRVGKTINAEGTLIDQIELRELAGGGAKSQQLEGRFTNIFQKYGF